ncbi:MAG: TldD/PmbA family protein [Myxococcota bacterium]|nr:TldD/PmbA family protein [Myxococcota bacterium]
MKLIALLGWAGSTAWATPEKSDVVLEALELELTRALDELSDEPEPPYFLAMEVVEYSAITLGAEEGGLRASSPSHLRWLDVDLRIGSPELDSTHYLRSSRDGDESAGRSLPIDDDLGTLRREVWREVDRRYQTARNRWAKVQGEEQILVEDEPAPDLSPTPVNDDLQAPARLELDQDRWEQILRDASAQLISSPVVIDGSVTLTAEAETHWFVNSEGTRIRHALHRYRINGTVNTIATDGDELRLSRSWDAHSESGLPSREEVLAGVQEIESRIRTLRDAPEEPPYSGPVILGDRATGVFFHEILGHRVEGHRLKRIDNAQTFRTMLGDDILPPFLSVYDDPTLDRFLETDLRGHYLFDNEGVSAQRADIVVDGELVGFLQSRSPVEPGHVSNGHGRRQRRKSAVTRQGNLIVEASSSVTNEELVEELRELASKRGLEYGLMVDEIQGGFTFTTRGIPNAFTVNVLVGRRVYVDGRPDQLVRGIDLIGTPVETFQDILLAGEAHDVFNGSCGAESGWVPVSAAAPSLLVGTMETQRKTKKQLSPPQLPPPGSVGQEVLQ